MSEKILENFLKAHKNIFWQSHMRNFSKNKDKTLHPAEDKLVIHLVTVLLGVLLCLLSIIYIPDMLPLW